MPGFVKIYSVYIPIIKQHLHKFNVDEWAKQLL